MTITAESSTNRATTCLVWMYLDAYDTWLYLFRWISITVCYL